jgi:hypothetical protein
MYLEVQHRFALFAFPEDPAKLVFTVRNRNTNAMEQYCACSIVHVVENLNVPKVKTRVVLQGDVRAHFILVPNVGSAVQYATKFPSKRIITPAQLFNYKAVEVDSIDAIFSNTAVQSDDYDPEWNSALEVLRKSGTLAAHECATSGTALFAISNGRVAGPEGFVVRLDAAKVNEAGKRQYGKDWLPVEPGVLRSGGRTTRQNAGWSFVVRSPPSYDPTRRKKK